MLIPLTRQEVKNLKPTNRIYSLEVRKFYNSPYKFNVTFSGSKVERNQSFYEFFFSEVPSSKGATLGINKYSETWTLYKECSDLEIRLIRILDKINLEKALNNSVVCKLPVSVQNSGLSSPLPKVTYGPRVQRGKIFRLIQGKTLDRTDTSYAEHRVKVYSMGTHDITFIQYKSTYEASPSYLLFTCSFIDNKKSWALFNK